MRVFPERLRSQMVEWTRAHVDPIAEEGAGLRAMQTHWQVDALESVALFADAFAGREDSPLMSLLVRSASLEAFAYAMTEAFESDPDAPELQVESVKVAGRSVPRLGLGCMRLVSHPFFADDRWHDAMALPFSPEENRHAFLNALRRCGIRYVDVARGYGPWPGGGESILRDWLVDAPEDVTASTKVGYRRSMSGTWWVDLAADALSEDVEGALLDMGERTDILYLVMRSTPEVEVKNRPADLRHCLAPFVAARDAGRISGIGLANATVEEIETLSREAPIAAVQNNFHIDAFDDPVRRAAFEHCRSAAIPFVMWGVFGEGARPEDDRWPKAVREAAHDTGLSAREAVIALLMATGPNVIVMPGASRRETIYSAVRAANTEFDAALYLDASIVRSAR